MKNELRLIIEEISKTRSILDDIYSYLKDFEQKELPKLGRNRTSGLVISQILENAYTSIETLFLRISQFFENSLDNERWHSDLLDKMNLRIEGIREQVISAETHRLLSELMRFRHFKRYYFELDYDWKKLDYLLDVYERLQPKVLQEIDSFSRFLKKMINIE